LKPSSPAVVATLLVAVSLAVPVGATQAAVTLRSYLARAVTLTEAEFAAIDSGRPINKALAPRSGPEIFVLGVVRVIAPPAVYVARALNPAHLMDLPGYRGTGVIGDPATTDQLAGFTLEPEDLVEARNCKPADCAVQFPTTVMQDVRAAAGNPNPATAAAQANQRVRQMAADLVRDYRMRGNEALPVFTDDSRPSSTRDQFGSLMQRFVAWSLAPPELIRVLYDYPKAGIAPPGLASVFSWEKVEFGLKPTLRVTHTIAYTPHASSGLGCAVAIKQLYSSHYMRAAIDFTACVNAADVNGRPSFYLVAVKGSRQENITGLTGSLIRRIVVSRTRTAQDGALTRLKNALEKAR